jgi:uncharacterized protein (TIGR02118 family)
MLHQLIFAAPKPGMSERDFQDYWVNKHAVQLASKIPQIRTYCVDTRIALPGETEPALFSGVVEIWLDDVAALLAALQSPELIHGARADEPNWAVFWQTIALNTETYEVLPGPPFSREGSRVKSIALVKRKPGMSVANFQCHALEVHAPKVLKLPGLRRYHSATSRTCSMPPVRHHSTGWASRSLMTSRRRKPQWFRTSSQASCKTTLTPSSNRSTCT